MKDKRGAMELSMSTIIIVVLGIMLLVVGFTFLDKISEFLDEGTEGIFEDALDKVKGVQDLKKPITISPSEINLEQEKGKRVTVYFYNMGTKTTTFKPEVYQSSTGDLAKNGIKCALLDTQPITLDSGDYTDRKMNVKENKGDLTLGEAYSCHIKITGGNLGKSNPTSTLIVEVE